MIVTRAESQHLYSEMCRIRAFEDEVAVQRGLGTVYGALHLCRGQEAVAVGVCSNLFKDDCIVGNHRSHGHCIAKGARLDKLMAELYGKSTGVCGGKGGSMHLADISNGILGANGIVSAGIGIASGAALSMKRQGRNTVAVSFFGDGAVSRGPFHEVLTIASLWKLPVVFVCENNQYQQWTALAAVAPKQPLSALSASYAIPGMSVDGQSVAAVAAAAATAIQHARSGRGPFFLEAVTYRFDGHSFNDEETYRKRTEVDHWKSNRDPILLFRRELLESGQMTEDEEVRIRDAIEQELRAAIRFASDSPNPEPQSAHEHVLSNTWGRTRDATAV